jgi:hypothetical protein
MNKKNEGKVTTYEVEKVCVCRVQALNRRQCMRHLEEDVEAAKEHVPSVPVLLRARGGGEKRRAVVRWWWLGA